MHILLPNIPASTSFRELSSFIEYALKKDLFNPFRSTGHIEDIEIMVLKDNNINLLEYHALINIEPNAAAKRLIKSIRMRFLKGKKVIARRYYPRDWHNDKRLPSENTLANKNNRRKTDRRRYDIEILNDMDKSFRGLNHMRNQHLS